MKAVALGGGRGLFATLSALRLLTDDITAIVTVADDGGSSGRLRRELGLLPPGDLRKALVALASNDPHDAILPRLFQHRFGGTGALAGHAVGNLILAGLLEQLGDPVAVLDLAGQMLGVRGRILPMCLDPLEIEAEVTGLAENASVVRNIRGQVAIATTPGKVRRIRLTNTAQPDQPLRVCPEAVDAIGDADVVLLGPGSWFTSVIPHLLVPELCAAIAHTTATTLVVLNLVPQPGETSGFSPESYLAALTSHVPDLRVDVVIADVNTVPTPDVLRQAATGLGAITHIAQIGRRDIVDQHDPAALATTIQSALALSGDRDQASRDSKTTLASDPGFEGGAPWQ